MTKESVSVSDNLSDELAGKLDSLVRLLQDIFILEAKKIDVNNEDLRKLLKIDKKRVNKISKLVKKAMAKQKTSTS